MYLSSSNKYNMNDNDTLKNVDTPHWGLDNDILKQTEQVT